MDRLTKAQYIQKIKNNADVETKKIINDNPEFIQVINNIMYSNYLAMMSIIEMVTRRK